MRHTALCTSGSFCDCLLNLLATHKVHNETNPVTLRTLFCTADSGSLSSCCRCGSVLTVTHADVSRLRSGCVCGGFALMWCSSLSRYPPSRSTAVSQRAHTHTHTHTHVRFCEKWGHPIGVMFLYCTNCMCYCPTPTLYLNLALTGDCVHFKFLPKKTSLCMIYKRFEKWGHGSMSWKVTFTL